MEWDRTAEKPLTEPVINQVTDVYMRHQGLNILIR